jgi:AraC-like DNA-binding protein
MARRIDRAKALLADPKLSVTDIALDIRFSETSSSSTAFPKLAGRRSTPYRRSLFDRPDTEEGLGGTATMGSRAQRAPFETFRPDSRSRGRS